VNRLSVSLLVKAQTALASVRGDEGQTFTEYAIIIAAITVGTVAAVGTLRDAVITAITGVANAI
jgi:Flp pilus assembly pilin Flp